MIKITEDTSSEMIMIEYKGKCIFTGNYWDFSRDSEGFKELFEGMEFKVEVVEKDYEEWYN